MANTKAITAAQTNTQATAPQVLKFSKDANANRRINMQRMQNVLLIWLDHNINNNNADRNNTIKQLKRIVNNINTFTDGEECVDFIKTIINNKICMIVSGALGEHIVPHVHDMSQVDTIFIFCNNQEWHKQWTKEWSKIKGIFTDITSICKALKQTAHQCEQNAISISFMASNTKFDQLDPSFMYTQILKEILLTITFEDRHFKKFITYFREAFVENECDLHNIEKLERDYHNQRPIWWYTYQCFLYSMLNQALRFMDVDIIVRMGFFINDLHRDIQRLHSEQFVGEESDKTFTVYRGQCLSKEDFTEMTKTKGGLLSFNNFLSTSKDRDVSLLFAPQAATNPDLVGILFVISINPTHSKIPFACVSDISHFHTEDEVLFSMHTVFRIGDIKPMDENNYLYEVNLTLTNDNDQDLRALSNQIRQETFPNQEGWYRLGLLLIKMGQFAKAQGIYKVLLSQTINESDKASIYYQLGWIKYSQGEYQKALSSHQKALTIRQKLLPSNHPDLGDSYSSIGNTYYCMSDNPKALLSHEKALAIRQQSLPSNHPDLGSSYNNIGLVYDSMGDYPKALLSHEKDLAILQQSLPSNHPDLGTSYNNIGNVYRNIGDYSKALSYYEKDLAILKQSLPFNHPDLGASYNNIGNMYGKMGDYQKTLSFYEKALAIRQQSLPSNHPDLASSYMGFGLVYYNMGDYPKALSYYEKALAIRQQSLPSSHPDLGASDNNIGLVYYSMGDYPKALLSHGKALIIRQQSLPSNHPDLSASYNNIGLVYNSMSDYSTALLSHGKALAIRQQSLPSNHPDLGASYNNIGVVYENMGSYSKADSFYERAAQIGQQSLPANHPNLKLYREKVENIKKKL
ncbi:unnamed protein product [Adineta steineri]|uniref:ADP ribosyltransferase domain-containing protein n=1 Tax=Adineta steineri TaxID=433720 RepID=A0A815Q2P8_9BILA|nr:unnamed protein product [Adineta steineri]CAF1351834.1 unnamed protein product [Adineta steineri]CAF1457769.1 unnamed protein product [Adineta steineri]CAF3522531.1 unnamed protein product [Adineta steineri]CAF3585042.1 unnamed protein product [Adineta steineri]